MLLIYYLAIFSIEEGGCLVDCNLRIFEEIKYYIEFMSNVSLFWGHYGRNKEVHRCIEKI